jgi:hypothetical protein
LANKHSEISSDLIVQRSGHFAGDNREKLHAVKFCTRSRRSVLPVVSLNACARAYPTVVVGFAPGGSPDIVGAMAVRRS